MRTIQEHQLFDIFIKKVDLTTLKEQKINLITIQDKFLNSLTREEYDAIEGLINLIDQVQDQAQEQWGLEDSYVFNLSTEE